MDEFLEISFCSNRKYIRSDFGKTAYGELAENLEYASPKMEKRQLISSFFYDTIKATEGGKI